MALAPTPVLLVAGPPDAAPPLRDRLASHGYAVTDAPPHALPDVLAHYTVLILDGRSNTADVLALCRRLSLRPPEERPPLLYVAPDDLAGRLAGFEHGADAVAGAAPPQELLAQVRVLERWHKARGQWLARAAEAQQFNQRLQQAYRQIETDLQLARRLQMSFLPQTLPAVGCVRFAVCYRPYSQVGGDFYDVFRLDEHHVGFYVADVMGHGVPASLLTIFLKKAVQPKEVTGARYRLVPPGELLARLNRELIEQKLAQMPFITMIYGLLDCRDGRLRFARAAHPHPVYLPRRGAPDQWRSSGALLGVFESEYADEQRQLHPGDKLLLFTDGLAHPASGSADPADSLLPVLAEHRDQPIAALVEKVSHDLLTQHPQHDDFTLLGVEILTG